MNEPVITTVAGHVLPAVLLRLIGTGGWRTPRMDAVVRVLRSAGIETGDGDVTCLSVIQMAEQLEMYVQMRDLGRAGPDPYPAWDAYGFESSVRVGGPVELPLLDLDQAVPIMLKNDDDTSVWLDYRTGEPRVVVPVYDPASARPTIGSKHVVVASSCQEFLRRLYGDDPA